MSKNFNPIIVVAGEPKSVFLELFFKSYKSFKKNPLILIANKKLLIDQLKLLKFKRSIKILNDKKKLNYNNLNNKNINLIDIPLNYRNLNLIKIKDANKYIKKSFDKAFELLNKNNKLKLLNGPIIKENFLGKKHLGITEYLGKKYNVTNKVVMLIHNQKLSVSPLTTHIPLKYVSKNISKKKIINHVQEINKFFKKRLNRKPSFAITGLNPHCESIHKFNEDDKVIKPAINFLKKKRYKIFGPYPADTLFMKKNIKRYDVVIGMYHDQVLTPMKTIYEFDAINVTLGLPFVRVSPDHGPNLRMFGKNKSNPKSLVKSIKFLTH
tara:strand:+ start:619 stop:1590 length:972 start_codon:yes stop_codon:yes gene_type:complete